MRPGGSRACSILPGRLLNGKRGAEALKGSSRMTGAPATLDFLPPFNSLDGARSMKLDHADPLAVPRLPVRPHSLLRPAALRCTPRFASTIRMPPMATGVLAGLITLIQGCAKSSSDDPPKYDPAVASYITSIPNLPDPVESDSLTQGNPATYPHPGIECEWTHRNVTIGPLTLPALAPHADVVYPGADVQGASLIDGVPSPITAPRGGGTIVISNVNGAQNVRELANVSLGSVTNAVNSIIANQPSEFPADLRLSVTRVRSQEELQLALQASASFFDLFSADASFQVHDNQTYQSFLVLLDQNFYSMVFERPDRIEQFWAPGVTATDLQAQVFQGNPAGYVSQITYGRVFYLLIEATEDSEEMESTISANLFDVANGSGQFQDMTQFSNFTVQAYAYGGSAGAALAAVQGGLGTLGSFLHTLRTGNDVTQAKAKSFTVRSIADDTVMKIGINLDYEYSDCHQVGDCKPNLQSPGYGAVIDNGCAVDSNNATWAFNWSSCAAATKYRIQVVHDDTDVVIDEQVTTSSYGYSTHAALPETHWKWRVRAFAYGLWNTWTSYRPFTLEPANQDCLTGVTVYTHPSFGGSGPQLFSSDDGNLENNGGWDDNIDSLKLHNVHGVWLYEDLHYTGTHFYFDHDCPDVEFHSTHAGAFHKNRASSLKIVP